MCKAVSSWTHTILPSDSGLSTVTGRSPPEDLQFIVWSEDARNWTQEGHLPATKLWLFCTQDMPKRSIRSLEIFGVTSITWSLKLKRNEPECSGQALGCKELWWILNDVPQVLQYIYSVHVNVYFIDHMVTNINKTKFNKNQTYIYLKLCRLVLSQRYKIQSLTDIKCTPAHHDTGGRYGERLCWLSMEVMPCLLIL